MRIASIMNLHPSRNALGSTISAATRPPISQPPCDGNSRRSVRKLSAAHAAKPDSRVKVRTGRSPQARIVCMAMSQHSASQDDVKHEQMAHPCAAASWVALSAVASVAAGIILPAHHAVAAELPTYSGVDDAQSELVQGLLKKSKENKAKNDQDRLDRFYKKEFAINKLLGTEVLPEACDPRDPEFGGKCLPRLPRLPEDRLGSESRSSEFQGFGGLTPMEEPDMFQ